MAPAFPPATWLDQKEIGKIISNRVSKSGSISNKYIVVMIIVSTAVGRIFSSFLLGLGMDDSYTVALGRELHLSYFDHPSLSWWLQWGMSRLFGSESAIVVKSPFIALFALSSWLVYRLTARLFSERSALWAVLAFSLATSWVSPDSSLAVALLGFLICLTRALGPGEGRPWVWWLGAGGNAGLALLANYFAIFVLFGAVGAVLSHPLHRRWKGRPHPWLAASLAAAIFLPVIVWHAPVFASAAVFTGDARDMLPWIWLPMLVELIAAWRRGPADWPRWLLACSGTMPILFFAAATIWSYSRISFDWVAPGYLVLFPLLGVALERWMRRRGRVGVPRFAAASAVLILAWVTVAAAQTRGNWLSLIRPEFTSGTAP